MFKQYQNKTSLFKKFSRILQGGFTAISGDKLGWWERKNFSESSYKNVTTFTVTPQYANRPDLIAYLFYKNTELEWVILQYNNIVDITEEIIVGAVLLIPENRYVKSVVVSNSAGTR